MAEIKTTTYAVTKDIVIKREYAVGCQVGNTGVTEDDNGRKIIKAGTPVGGSTDVLKDRTAVLIVTNDSTNGAKSQGVVDCDVDVTDGNANATLLVRGVVDLEKMDPDLTIDSAAATALASRVLFQKGAK